MACGEPSSFPVPRRRGLSGIFVRNTSSSQGRHRIVLLAGFGIAMRVLDLHGSARDRTPGVLPPVRVETHRNIAHQFPARSTWRHIAHGAQTNGLAPMSPLVLS